MNWFDVEHQARGMVAKPQTEASSEKITLPQSRSIFSWAQASRLATWRSDKSGFLTVLRHFTLVAHRCSRMATCDNSRPFCFNFACPWRKDKLGLRENKATIHFSSFLVTFTTESRFGRSSTVFWLFKSLNPLLDKRYRLFNVFSRHYIVHFWSFRVCAKEHGLKALCVNGTHRDFSVFPAEDWLWLKFFFSKRQRQRFPLPIKKNLKSISFTDRKLCWTRSYLTR